MYDIKKLVHAEHVTVEEVIDHLKTLPKDALFTCCGDDYMFIHVEEDGSVVTIDTESLCETGAYPDEDLDIFPLDNEIQKIGGSLHRNMVQVKVVYTEDAIVSDDCEYMEGYYYWTPREEFQSEEQIISLYSGIYKDSHCLGTILRKFAVPTGNVYIYKEEV